MRCGSKGEEGEGKEEGEEVREVLGSKQDRIRVSKGDLLEWITWGGGGWRDPLQRDPEVVALEVRRGLVTAEGARRYGVVVRADLTLDGEGTERLRDGMRAERGKDRGGELGEVFDRGGTWAELKGRCEEETGLAPPRDPRDVPLRGPMTRMPYFERWKEGRFGGR